MNSGSSRRSSAHSCPVNSRGGSCVCRLGRGHWRGRRCRTRYRVGIGVPLVRGERGVVGGARGALLVSMVASLSAGFCR